MHLGSIEIDRYLPGPVIAERIDSDPSRPLDSAPITACGLRLFGHNALTLRAHAEFEVALAQLESRKFHVADLQGSRSKVTGGKMVEGSIGGKKSIVIQSAGLSTIYGSLGCSIILSAARPFFRARKSQD
eukprot:8610441-Pyramimonas_sp.AAC.1